MTTERQLHSICTLSGRVPSGITDHVFTLSFLFLREYSIQGRQSPKPRCIIPEYTQKENMRTFVLKQFSSLSI